MSRPNRGPRLVPKQPRGYTKKYWFIRWYEQGRKLERSTGCPVSGPAAAGEAALAEFISRSHRPIGPCHPDEVLICDVLDRYAMEHGAHVAAPERIDYAVAALLPFWGDLKVSAIKSETCKHYQRSRAASPGTVRRELGCLSAALEYNLKEGYLTSRPPVWLPEKPPSKDRYLTRPETAALLCAARSEPRVRFHLPLFIMIGIYTGARKEAILSLRWTRNMDGGWIDLNNARIDFNPIGRTQTKKRRPVIPIPKRLLRFLLAARSRTNSDCVVNFHGKRVLDVKKAFASAVGKAGLEDASPHALRHTCATWMAQRGIAPVKAAEYLGMTVETFERVYWHHSPDFMQEAATAFD